MRFQFSIPRGSNGTAGQPGAPGEVSNAQLTAAINGTTANSNGVTTLDTAPSDPPTFADYEVMRAKVNERIVALRRLGGDGGTPVSGLALEAGR
ncbi:MAG: hypothetical protein KA152_14255 [Verrucomicrobiales bacterium]|nr:hypothetical protein [Verrucomicrobiales bacterium]